MGTPVAKALGSVLSAAEIESVGGGENTATTGVTNGISVPAPSKPGQGAASLSPSTEIETTVEVTVDF